MSSKSYGQSAFMFSSSTVIRNGALLVIDCSGCLHYGTERQVSYLVVFVFVVFLIKLYR